MLVSYVSFVFENCLIFDVKISTKIVVFPVKLLTKVKKYW